jgi:hypothetical protein
MKKQLNVDLIQSELRGGSAFFPGYKGSRPSVPSTPTAGAQLGTEADSKPKTLEPVSAEPADQQHGSPIGIDSPLSTQGVPPPVPRPGPRTVPGSDHLIPKVKRPMRQRQPFDIYEDQYERLKQIADSERNFVNGRGMSQMVREAIDTYLAANFSPSKKQAVLNR